MIPLELALWCASMAVGVAVLAVTALYRRPRCLYTLALTSGFLWSLVTATVIDGLN